MKKKKPCNLRCSGFGEHKVPVGNVTLHKVTFYCVTIH